jgi:hypothetical protein
MRTIIEGVESKFGRLGSDETKCRNAFGPGLEAGVTPGAQTFASSPAVLAVLRRIVKT